MEINLKMYKLTKFGYLLSTTKQFNHTNKAIKKIKLVIRSLLFTIFQNFGSFLQYTQIWYEDDL